MSSDVDGTGLSGVHWLPGGERLVAEARAEMPQKDGLAAAFTALAVLRAAGVAGSDQDEVAITAGTVRDFAPPPPGAVLRQDFRLDVPRDPVHAGTSAPELAGALRTLSGGRLEVAGVSGPWRPDALFDLLLELWDLPRVAVLARLDPAELGAPDTPRRALTDYLATGIPPLWTNRWRPPAPHHVLIAGVRIGAEGTLLSVVDTYREVGAHGVHEQPLEWVTAGLDTVLLVADADHAAFLERTARQA
ncbi:DUF6885 family protein [Amycolatopsis jiangsuensis]|nr:hypothetical protein [Amycolatopsis jiangsuensis]